MMLCDELQIPRGVTSLIGSGGKTTLMLRLADELSRRGRVIVTTSTKILVPDFETLLSPTADEVRKAFCHTNLLAIGMLFKDGKLTEVTALRELLPSLCDYALIEADGAHRLPIKAPAEYEPVVPPQTALTIGLFGAQGFGRTIAEAAHRPQIFAAVADVPENVVVTPEIALRVMQSPLGLRKGERGRFITVINQADSPERRQAARACASKLSGDAYITALLDEPNFCEHWRNGTCLL